MDMAVRQRKNALKSSPEKQFFNPAKMPATRSPIMRSPTVDPPIIISADARADSSAALIHRSIEAIDSGSVIASFQAIIWFWMGADTIRARIAQNIGHTRGARSRLRKRAGSLELTTAIATAGNMKTMTS